MAKFEYTFAGDFTHFLAYLSRSVLEGSVSASAEGSSDFATADTRVAVRVFERYSMLGNNRVSLNVTVVGVRDVVHVVAITSGGSQAALWKVNTFGEESFLEKAKAAILPYAPPQDRLPGENRR